MTTKPDTPDLPDVDVFEEDPTSKFIDEYLANAEGEKDEEEDKGGLDQPYEEPDLDAVAVVGQDEARDIMSDAELGKKKTGAAKKTKPEGGEGGEGEEGQGAASEAEKGDAAGKDDDTKEAAATDQDGDGAKKGEGDVPDLTASTSADLLEGLPDDHKAELNRRLKAGDDIAAAFNTQYAQQQMKQHGSSPAQVASRLVELATFAQDKPDEYIAWAATQMASDPSKVQEVLGAAVERLGFSLVAKDADSEDDDLFDDPEKRELKARLAEFEKKKAGGQPEFGPDTPERVQQRTTLQQITAVADERGPDGQLLRPLWPKLEGQIAQMASAKAKTGTQVTTADLGTFYDQAVADMRAAFGLDADGGGEPGDGSAAQDTPSVAEQIKEQKAAAAAKAKRASTTLSGSGQGTSRAPAISKGARVEEVIDTLWNQMTG